MKQVKQTERLFVIEQPGTREALIKASDLQKVEEVAHQLDADQWVTKPVASSLI